MRPYLGLVYFSYDHKHIWAVVSDPDEDFAKVVIVSFSSCKPGCDEPAEFRIQPGEHPAFSAETYVAHYKTSMVPGAWIEARCADGHFARRDPRMSTSLLSKVLKAMQASPDTPTACKEKIAEQIRVKLARRAAAKGASASAVAEAPPEGDS